MLSGSANKQTSKHARAAKRPGTIHDNSCEVQAVKFGEVVNKLGEALDKALNDHPKPPKLWNDRIVIRMQTHAW